MTAPLTPRHQRALTGSAVLAFILAALYGLSQLTPASANALPALPVATNLAPCPVLSTVPAGFSAFPETPAAGLHRGIVTVAFDDGFQSVYTDGLPILIRHHIPSTQYIISGNMQNEVEYVSADEVAEYVRDGQEIGAHTVTHPHLGTLTPAQAAEELALSRGQLTAVTAPAGQAQVCDFAPPFGEPTNPTSTMGVYSSARGLSEGFNGLNTNPYQINVQIVVATITPAEVQGWIDLAAANNYWLVLVYHSVSPTADAVTNPNATLPANLETEMAAVQNSTLTPLSMSAALTEVIPQR
jgi:peptidoglycan/xylan/chitin deacetylase (PgdA/CDA1 family)